jgi:hypothetical protein
MTDVVMLAPGTRLSVGLNMPKCRLSAIVVDSSKRKIGLSADHILSLAHDDRIYDHRSGIVIGHRIRFASRRYGLVSSEQEHAFFETVGAFEIFDRSQGSDIVTTNLPITGVSRPGKAIGHGVSIVNGSDPSTMIGELLGFGGSVALANPHTQEVRSFVDPLIISLSPDKPDPAVAGEGGASVLDKGGNLVGILISKGETGAKGETRVYAAPVESFLTRYNLSLLHIAEAEARPEPRPSSEISEEVKEFTEAVASEQPVHKDPEGKQMPRHLVDYYMEVEAA